MIGGTGGGGGGGGDGSGSGSLGGSGIILIRYLAFTSETTTTTTSTTANVSTENSGFLEYSGGNWDIGQTLVQKDKRDVTTGAFTSVDTVVGSKLQDPYYGKLFISTNNAEEPTLSTDTSTGTNKHIFHLEVAGPAKFREGINTPRVNGAFIWSKFIHIFTPSSYSGGFFIASKDYAIITVYNSSPTIRTCVWEKNNGAFTLVKGGDQADGGMSSSALGFYAIGNYSGNSSIDIINYTGLNIASKVTCILDYRVEQIL